MTVKIFTVGLSIILLSVVSSEAQRPQEDLFGEEVIEVEEILIKVEPEQPNVIVTPVRQPPEIVEEVLQPDIQRMVDDIITPVKPVISDVEITPIEKPREMLAKER